MNGLLLAEIHCLSSFICRAMSSPLSVSCLCSLTQTLAQNVALLSALLLLAVSCSDPAAPPNAVQCLESILGCSHKL